MRRDFLSAKIQLGYEYQVVDYIPDRGDFLIQIRQSHLRNRLEKEKENRFRISKNSSVARLRVEYGTWKNLKLPLWLLGFCIERLRAQSIEKLYMIPFNICIYF